MTLEGPEGGHLSTQDAAHLRACVKPQTSPR
jgi:hypothetical protein